MRCAPVPSTYSNNRSSNSLLPKSTIQRNVQCKEVVAPYNMQKRESKQFLVISPHGNTLFHIQSCWSSLQTRFGLTASPVSLTTPVAVCLQIASFFHSRQLVIVVTLSYQGYVTCDAQHEADGDDNRRLLAAAKKFQVLDNATHNF